MHPHLTDPPSSPVADGLSSPSIPPLQGRIEGGNPEARSPTFHSKACPTDQSRDREGAVQSPAPNAASPTSVPPLQGGKEGGITKTREP